MPRPEVLNPHPRPSSSEEAAWLPAAPGDRLPDHAKMRSVVGFRVILPDLNTIEVIEASEYLVTDDGALVLRDRGKHIRTFPLDSWVDIRSLNLSPPRDVDVLLATLCVRLGLCLPPGEAQRLKDSPPLDPDAFTNAFLIAYGLDPTYSSLRRQVLDKVTTNW
jgi:hypothetical protein